MGKDLLLVDGFGYVYGGFAAAGRRAVGKEHRVARARAGDGKAECALLRLHGVDKHLVDKEGRAEIGAEPGAAFVPSRQGGAAVGDGVIRVEVGVEEIRGRAGARALDKSAAFQGAESDIVANSYDLDFGQSAVWGLFFGDDLDILDDPIVEAFFVAQLQTGVDDHGAVAAGEAEGDANRRCAIGLRRAINLAVEEEVLGGGNACAGGDKDAKLAQGAGALLVGKCKAYFLGQRSAPEIDGDKPIFLGIVGAGLPVGVEVAVDDEWASGRIRADLPQAAGYFIASGPGLVCKEMSINDEIGVFVKLDEAELAIFTYG